MKSISYTLWLFNIAMENGSFIDGLPIKMVIFHGYVGHNQMVMCLKAITVDLHTRPVLLQKWPDFDPMTHILKLTIASSAKISSNFRRPGPENSLGPGSDSEVASTYI